MDVFLLMGKDSKNSIKRAKVCLHYAHIIYKRIYGEELQDCWEIVIKSNEDIQELVPSITHPSHLIEFFTCVFNALSGVRNLNDIGMTEDELIEKFNEKLISYRKNKEINKQLMIRAREIKKIN